MDTTLTALETATSTRVEKSNAVLDETDGERIALYDLVTAVNQELDVLVRRIG